MQCHKCDSRVSCTRCAGCEHHEVATITCHHCLHSEVKCYHKEKKEDE